MPAQTMQPPSVTPPPAWVAERFHTALRRRALSLTGNQAGAEDLVQDTYERALRTPIPCDRGEQAMIGWLFRIMYNRFIDEKRRERSQPSVQWSDLDPSHQPANDVSELPPRWRLVSDEALRAYMDRLPPKLREILLLKEQGHGTRFIATRLGIHTATVATRLFRARAQLRQLAVVTESPYSRFDGGGPAPSSSSPRREARAPG